MRTPARAAHIFSAQIAMSFSKTEEDGVVRYFDASKSLHREDGPAYIVRATGASAHYLRGVLMTPREHRWIRRKCALIRNAPMDIILFI